MSQSVARTLTRRAIGAFVAECTSVAPVVALSGGLVNVENVVDGGTRAEMFDASADVVVQREDNPSVPTHILVQPLGSSNNNPVFANPCCRQTYDDG